MPKLRFSPFATIVQTSSGVFVRSDLALFQIGGSGVKSFVSRLLPLLDGKRDRAAILRSLPNYSPESITSLLDVLDNQGLLEEVDSRPGLDRWRGQREFFRKWPDANGDAQGKLARSRVLVAGLEPWGAVCATELAAAGVGSLDLLDEGRVAEPLSGVWERKDVGQLRRAALSRLIRARAPGCRVTSHSLKLSASGKLSPLKTSYDLAVVATHRDDLRLLLGVARFAHRARLRSLAAFVDGLEGVVGPAVIPGRTACWNCFRLRSLAHAEPLAETQELQEALLKRSANSEVRHTYLGPMLPLLGHLTALEALKILSGYTPSKLFGRVIVQDLVTLHTSTHTLIRMPWCEVCGGAAAGGSGPDEGGERPPELAKQVGDARNPSELRHALDGWVDERFGVIRRLIADTPDQRGPELPFTSAALLVPYSEDIYQSTDGAIASGRGLAPVDAMRGAAAEGLERYSAARYRKHDLRRCSFDELDGDKLDPREIFFYEAERYNDSAFPFVAFQSKQPLEWVPGSWLDRGSPVWVPAMCAYYGYDTPPAEQFGQITTNGLAAGRDFNDAAMRAVFELIERDAFILSWLARLPARELDTRRSLDSGSMEVVRQLEEQGALVKLYLLDVGYAIPVVVCVSFGDGCRWPGATIALGCHLSPRVAAQRAILEQGQSSPHLRSLLESGKAHVPATPDAVASMMDHAFYYFPRERSRAFDFLRSGEANPLTLGEIDEPGEISLAECGRRLLDFGLRVALVDVTSPDLKDGPVRVVRALGPWFQPVDFGHKLQRLANPRLKVTAPNPDPHPLA
jgi:ribosomal protein S12 methylthiotransferase accessory factor